MSGFPVSLSAWHAEAQRARADLLHRLGDTPPLFIPEAKTTSREQRDGLIVEGIQFDNGAGAAVPAYILIPPDLRQRAPAILFLHAHGGKYEVGKEEIFRTRPSGAAPALALARAGYVVLCSDAYAFGARAAHSPGGKSEPGKPTEEAWFKHFLWLGSTLWGMIVRDDRLALTVLQQRPEVDPARIGAVGMSMGGSRVTWLGALDERVSALIAVGQMTRYADFAAIGDYNLHSIYYYVPGMRASGCDMEQIVALSAPRPQAILIGDSDPLSPITGVQTVIDYATHIYALHGVPARFLAQVEAGVGHVFTPTMQSAMLAAFGRWL